MDGIGTSLFFDRGRDRLTALNSQADTLQGQISTGKRLSAPSQDAVAWQRLQGLAQAKSDNNAYAGNITLAQGLLDQTDATLGSVQNQLQRAQELTIQVNSGVLSADNRKVIADQLAAIAADLTTLAATRDTRGQSLFDANAAAIPVDDGVAVIVGADPARVFGTIVASLNSFADDLRSGTGATVPGAATALAALDAATGNVSAARGAAGARSARLDVIAATHADAAVTTESQRSALEDTDLTSAIADLQKTMTILSATQASFTKLTSLSLFDYLR